MNDRDGNVNDAPTMDGTTRVAGFGQNPAERLATLIDILDCANNNIAVADASTPDLPIVYVNRGFEQLTGYGLDEAVGRNCRFLQGDDRDQPGLRAIRTALAEGTDAHAVVRNYRKDGTPFWNELHLSHLKDAGGRVRYVVGVQNDVTRRVQLETQLREAIEEAVADASWFTEAILDKLRQIRTGRVVESSRLADLTAREREVLEWVAAGLGNAQIAAKMSLADTTVRNYVASVYDKLGVHSRAEAIVWARERGIMSESGGRPSRSGDGDAR